MLKHNLNIKSFERNFWESPEQIAGLGTGAIGGKAKGLVFINDVVEKLFPEGSFSGIEVKIPKMVVLRTDVFDTFLKENNLDQIAYSNLPDERIAHAFQKAVLPFNILGDLRALIAGVKSPLAIRSSSLLEDAMYEPFAGVYASKMTPNNQHDTETRFNKLVEAIKYIYASTFFKAAKDYIKATKHKVVEEKMALIIQEVVGQKHEKVYYPDISGVIRSYNFYPMSPAKPNEGIVNLALGLGKTIVDGGKTWAFSPAYPNLSPPYGSIREMLNQTQTKFYGINMGELPAYDPINEEEFLLLMDIDEAIPHGNMKYIASTYSWSSDRLDVGISPDGPVLINFGLILKHEEILLNELIKRLLAACERALDEAVEIEFALSLHKGRPHRFGFLQVRPMVVATGEVNIEKDELFGEQVLVSSESVLGNGIWRCVKDIVYVKPESFDGKRTREIAMELEALNETLVDNKSPYLLIGFGRWGSSDPFMNIPVSWGQISGVRAIVEASLEGVNVDLSQGSHFFHNLTSLGVSYFSIPFNGDYMVDWEWLNQQPLNKETEFLKHVKLSLPIEIRVDGRTGFGVINKQFENFYEP